MDSHETGREHMLTLIDLLLRRNDTTSFAWERRESEREREREEVRMSAHVVEIYGSLLGVGGTVDWRTLRNMVVHAWRGVAWRFEA